MVRKKQSVEAAVEPGNTCSQLNVNEVRFGRGHLRAVGVTLQEDTRGSFLVFHFFGWLCVTVATGPGSLAELRASDPDRWVLHLWRRGLEI